MENAVEIYKKVIELAKEKKCLFEFDWREGKMNGVVIKDFETGSQFALGRKVLLDGNIEEEFYKNYNNMMNRK